MLKAERVSFAYRANAPRVVDEVSLAVEPGGRRVRAASVDRWY